MYCYVGCKAALAAEKMVAMLSAILVHEKWHFIPVKRTAVLQLLLSGSRSVFQLLSDLLV